MSAPYFQLLGHTYLAIHACNARPELAQALIEAGLGRERIEEGAEIVARAKTLPDRRLEEAEENRIGEHNLHSAIEEVEMWNQTMQFRIKRAVDDVELRATIFAEDVHPDEHSLEVIARALRVLAMVRTHPTLHEQFGTGRKVRDLLIRGNTLLEKSFVAGDNLLSPGAIGDPDAEIFTDIDETTEQMQRWMEDLDVAAEALADRPALLGELGHVPEDVGLPLGGTGYSITLHERSERHPPDPDAKESPDPSWTIGRQGRNSENLGKGWIESSFE
jgi:hypothetical protein